MYAGICAGAPGTDTMVSSGFYCDCSSAVPVCSDLGDYVTCKATALGASGMYLISV